MVRSPYWHTNGSPSPAILPKIEMWGLLAVVRKEWCMDNWAEIAKYWLTITVFWVSVLGNILHKWASVSGKALELLIADKCSVIRTMLILYVVKFATQLCGRDRSSRSELRVHAASTCHNVVPWPQLPPNSVDSIPAPFLEDLQCQ